METGQLAQAAINVLEWSGDIMDAIWNPFEAESFLEGIFQNDVRFWSAIVIFLIWLSVLIRVIKDANARSSSFRFQLLAIFLVVAFTPVFWLMLYIAIRPQWWKWDKHRSVRIVENLIWFKICIVHRVGKICTFHAVNVKVNILDHIRIVQIVELLV